MIKVTLRSPIFNKTARRQAFSNFISRQRKDFKSLTQRRMVESQPTGRLYSRRAGAGFKRSHRASAYGQRPAIDSGKLLRSIYDKRTGDFSGEVVAGAEYAKYLQSRRLNRPIMNTADAKEAQAKMNRDAIPMLRQLL